MTAITVKMVSRSWFGSVFGSTEAIASAAEAPQIATAPPASSPKGSDRPDSRASTTPPAMVSTTPARMTNTTSNPAAAICWTVIPSPSSATPKRSSRREANSMPGSVGAPGSARKAKAMPSSSAISITGAP